MTNSQDYLTAEINNIERTLGDLRTAWERPVRLGVELTAAAAYLQDVYHGMENILKHLLKSKGVMLPNSGSWHKDLVGLAVVHGILSPVLSEQVLVYLGFRHYFLHSYGFSLKESQLDPLVKEVVTVWVDFKEAVSRFNQL